MLPPCRQAADRGGRQSQTIVEVAVVPGPNSGGPVFRQSLYDADVSEGARVGSTVLTVTVRLIADGGYRALSTLQGCRFSVL